MVPLLYLTIQETKYGNLMESWSRESGLFVVVSMSASSFFRDSRKSVPISVFLVVFFFSSSTWRHPLNPVAYVTGYIKSQQMAVVDREQHVVQGGSNTYSCQLSRRPKPYLQSKPTLSQQKQFLVLGGHFGFNSFNTRMKIFEDYRYF